ncbi:MAG TPA: hypothetical protein VGP55_06745 [Chitinophagaceae bacterium]|nr:hypothetical protein [Chitinophagaceae bacterium]
MKKYVTTTITLLIPIILFAQPLPQQNNSFDPNAFKIIDIKNIAANYMIVSCRNEFGRTVQFITGLSQGMNGTSIPLSLGTAMITDFNAKTISPSDATTFKYKIVKPGFSDQCCLVFRIEHDRNDSIDFVIAKTDTANELTYFKRKMLTIDSPNLILEIGQPIYQMLFNNKSYAILKPSDEGEINKNIFYSYGFNVMTKEFYNSLHRKITDTSINLPTIDSLRRNSSADSSGSTEMSEIMFGKNMATGTINVAVPLNVDYTIEIYNLPDHTLLYNSNQQRNFSLFPGIYDIGISGIIVKNIQIDKGMDTRIKAGTFSMNYHISWNLYDENKLKILYKSSLPVKIEIPKGIYQLEINGLFNQVEIKDKETLEYDSTWQQSHGLNISDSVINTQIQKPNFGDSNKTVQIQKSNVFDSGNYKIIKHEVSNHLIYDKNWEMKPAIPKTAPGKIFIEIPRDVECITSILQANSEKEVNYSGALTNERNFPLPPGIFDVKLSGSIIKNVPLQKGMDTRIKAGILHVVFSGIWTLYDEKKNKQIYFSVTAKKIGLPIGIYQLEINGTVKQIIIKDGETLEF